MIDFANLNIYSVAGAGLTTLFFALLILAMLKGKNITIWHALAIGAAAGFAASIAQSYTQLVDWIILGITGVNAAAMLFVVGIVAMAVVMLYNLLSTRGKTLVR